MKTKSKMKDFDVEFKEWWEIIEEYFSKELEKNLAQHKGDERTYMYKLEVYQRTFIDFICGSLISTKALNQDEENEARPSGTTQKKDVQVEEP
jgi:hypothetical protein